MDEVSVEVYFDDLTPEKQRQLLREFETTEAEENWNDFPIFVLTREKLLTEG